MKKLYVVFLLVVTVLLFGCSKDIDRTGEKVFRDTSKLTPPATIKVDSVKVVQETNFSLILDVSYTYQNDVPPDQVKLFVLPDMPYWATNSVVVLKGSNTVSVSIDLYEQKMKEDHVSNYETSKLNISFDQYLPDRFVGSIYNQLVPFKKTWKAR